MQLCGQRIRLPGKPIHLMCRRRASWHWISMDGHKSPRNYFCTSCSNDFEKYQIESYVCYMYQKIYVGQKGRKR